MADISPQPKLQFFTSAGVPLSGGKLYTYQAGTTTPLASYTSSSGSVANTNPVILDSRGEASVWLNPTQNYKFKLTDANDVEIWTVDNLSGPVSAAALSASTGSSLVGYIRGEAGAVKHTVQDKLRERVSVFDFMTDAQISGVQAGTYTGDLSDAFEAAINTSKRVYIPKGRYRVNVQIDSKTILEGDGSQSTILYPYNDAVAIMTYTFTAQQTPAYAFWDYHSEVHGIGFWGKTTRTGVGFTFGTTVPANYTTNMEYANNVKFFGCRFYNLEKGVQFPFGNIGTEFYSCGFSSNKYGAYLLDNKFPAGAPAAMHAGNKYWYAGEFSGNECAVYLNNVTDGFGAVAWKDTIFEYNLCAGYFYVTPRPITPVSWDGCWFEGNGTISSGASTITISTWTGAVEGTQTLPKKTLIFDGSQGVFDFKKSFFTDIRVKGTSIAVLTENCRTEISSGFNGGPIEVDSPTTSYVRCVSPFADNGFPQDGGTLVVGYPYQFALDMNDGPANAGGRWFFTKNRTSRVKNFPQGSTGSGNSGSLKASLSFTSYPYITNGTAVVTSTVEGTGTLYSICAGFERAAFAGNQYLNIDSPSATFVLSESGYYVVTVDWQRVTGNPRMYVWDRNLNQLITGAALPEANRWYTVAAIGHSNGNGASMILDFSGGPVTETCKWRLGGYQVVYFQYFSDAQNYLESGVFAENPNTLVIPSAATLYLPQEMDTVLISGTTGITSIYAGLQAGRRITLVFQDALTVTDGSNLKLNGNFVTTADDTLTLVCDGTNWYEVARSAN